MYADVSCPNGARALKLKLITFVKTSHGLKKVSLQQTSSSENFTVYSEQSLVDQSETEW